ncbi:MAG: exo-alpha-sialidase [Saprospiraceae bacterium]|nr:exo-alpha-sialidase [Saprospiraceae bacterium]
MKHTLLLILLSLSQIVGSSAQNVENPKKIKDVIIYEDPQFYAAFPSVIKQPNGELCVAFRRAPDRRIFGEKGNDHTDPNSYLVMVRSKDGEHWTKVPELIYANPYGGSQDPCLLQLEDGTILCASYGWAFVKPEGLSNLKKPYFDAGDAIFLGGYILRSINGGKTWSPPIYPPHIEQEVNFNAYGIPIPAYNRGAMYEGKNGNIYWIVAASDGPNKTSNHLLISEDKGLTWKYASIVATDEQASFNEASIYETPARDLVGFLRTSGMDDQACIARSADGGKTFKWESMGFQGHPLNALRLPDRRVLLTYGYRHKPFGIRARILNAECTNFKTAPEIILRDDGGNSDIGYTWPVQLDENRVLVTYYFNLANDTRHIAGTMLEIKPIKNKRK